MRFRRATMYMYFSEKFEDNYVYLNIMTKNT